MWRSHCPGNFLPRVVRIGGTKHDLKIGRHFPQLPNGLHAIPSWRHPDVHKRQCVRTACGLRSVESGESLVTLKCGVDHKVFLRNSRRGLLSK